MYVLLDGLSSFHNVKYLVSCSLTPSWIGFCNFKLFSAFWNYATIESSCLLYRRCGYIPLTSIIYDS